MRQRRLKRRAFWGAVLLELLLLALVGTVVQVIVAAAEATGRLGRRPLWRLGS